MSLDFESVVLRPFDPIRELEEPNLGSEFHGKARKGATYVHVRVQQRAGKKSLTTIEGLSGSLNHKRVLKDLKQLFCCNGTLVQDEEAGLVIQLSGDQRKGVVQFLTSKGLVGKENIKVHGF